MTLLLGNSETSFATAEATAAKVATAFAFTGAETGLLEELRFRTNGTANTGVTSVRLGVFSDEGGTPGNVIQEGVVSGAPGTNSWIIVAGLTIPILKNATYWLAVLSLGGPLHYNVHGSGGSGAWRRTNNEHENLYEFSESHWVEVTTEGPLGFQGLGKAGVGSEQKLLFGIDSNNINHGHTAWTSHRVCLGRGIDVDYKESTPAAVSAAVGEALAAGITPLVIINTNDEIVLSEISESVESPYAPNAVAIIKKVIEQHPAVRTFEIINEPFSKGPHRKSNASDYATILLTTYEKLTAEHITGAHYWRQLLERTKRSMVAAKAPVSFRIFTTEKAGSTTS